MNLKFNVFIRSETTLFSPIFDKLVFLTFKNLPRKGKIPKLFLPFFPKIPVWIPATAYDLADSPSQTIRMLSTPNVLAGSYPSTWTILVFGHFSIFFKVKSSLDRNTLFLIVEITDHFRILLRYLGSMWESIFGFFNTFLFCPSNLGLLTLEWIKNWKNGEMSDFVSFTSALLFSASSSPENTVLVQLCVCCPPPPVIWPFTNDTTLWPVSAPTMTSSDPWYLMSIMSTTCESG